jgi:hypothetical protein
MILQSQLTAEEIASLDEPRGRVLKSARNTVKALREFNAKMRPGDTMWSFNSAPEAWANLRGSRGLVIMRGNQKVAEFVMMEN